jgi:hypothetical protein
LHRIVPESLRRKRRNCRVKTVSKKRPRREG